MKNICIKSLLLFLVAFYVSVSSVVAAGTLTTTKKTAVKTYATTDDTFANGWKWIYDVTVPDNETKLQMKFSDWTSGTDKIVAAGNTKFYSVGTSTITIGASDTYSDVISLGDDLDLVTPGRQVQITVVVKAPIGSADGSYSSNYAVYTEAIPIPTLSYTSPNIFTVNSAIATLSPTVTGTVDSYSVSPDLPAGLSINTSNGQITGTPTVSTTQATYTVTATNTGGSTTFGVVIMVNNTVVGAGGKVWMDRNLGATRIALSSTDTSAYGDLYQWGRLVDGHQIRTSETTVTLSSTDVPIDAKYILNSSPGTKDWRSPKNDNLWQGVSGTNNPCPTGFRLPTIKELEIERVSWSSSNATGAFDSTLKLTIGGGRYNALSGGMDWQTYGIYWSSSISSTNALNLIFGPALATTASENNRTDGFSVRCTANDYAVSYNANGSTSGSVPANQSKTSDITLVLRTNSGTLVKTGYTFSGWNTSADGSGTTYSVGDNYTTNDSVVLYAKWTVIPLAIGDSYQGGKIFYILQSGDTGYDVNVQHGLIAANSNQGEVPWGCSGTSISGADGTAIGTGRQNTLDMINAGCLGAAPLVYNVNIGGYTDWYLASKDEMAKLYIYTTIDTGFLSWGTYYWTSSESSAANAWYQWFTQGVYGKNTGSGIDVRAVRSF